MKEYQPQVTPDSPARCAHCPWEGTQAQFREHLRVWDDAANPVRPKCPGVRFFIDPDPANWTTVDRYSVLTRQNVLAGMKPKKAAREAAYAVGYRDRPAPMPDEVKEMLRERNEQEREIKRGMKRRSKSKGKKRRAS
jgi:hypothetical protein